MARGKDPVCHPLRRTVRRLMTGTASRTKLPTVPAELLTATERDLARIQAHVRCKHTPLRGAAAPPSPTTRLLPLRHHPAERHHQPQPIPVHRPRKRPHRPLLPPRPLLQPNLGPLHLRRLHRTRWQSVCVCGKQSAEQCRSAGALDAGACAVVQHPAWSDYPSRFIGICYR